MEDLHFRKKLIVNEIEILKQGISKNEEFIRLFKKQNVDFIKQITSYLQQIEYINTKLLKDGENKS